MVKKPWVGMRKGFWRDPVKYMETYWSRWESIWVHGDFARNDEDNLWYILGRSDDTIKGEEVVAFVVLKPGYKESPVLGRELIDYVAKNAGKALSPKVVKFVNDILKTRNAKMMRRVIRKVYLGENPGDLSALENLDSIEEIKKSRGN